MTQNIFKEHKISFFFIIIEILVNLFYALGSIIFILVPRPPHGISILNMQIVFFFILLALLLNILAKILSILKVNYFKNQKKRKILNITLPIYFIVTLILSYIIISNNLTILVVLILIFNTKLNYFLKK